MKRLKWKNVAVPLRHEVEARPISIVSDAAIATRGFGDGRLIPLVILDTTTRPDVEAMIVAHRDLGPGDSTSAWARRSRFDWRGIRLVLTVTNPSRCTMVLDFDIDRQGGLVDQIVHP